MEVKGHQIIQETGEVHAGILGTMSVDFVISSGYAHIIRPDVIEAFPRKIINLHNSYLPYGKGIYPNLWASFDNTPSGVSIHLVDEGIDTGEVIVQRRVQLDDDDTLYTSWVKLMSALDDLFIENFDDILNQKLIPTESDSQILGTRNHTRLESERLMGLLPKMWDTPLAEVASLGSDAYMSGQFWAHYDGEATRAAGRPAQSCQSEV